MSSNLVIVESPAKAKTIKKYLGKDFEVLASYGHVRDLVPKEGAVDPKHHFAMKYQVVERNQKHVDAIAKALKKAKSLFLATDPDREGEAISWHLYELLQSLGALEGKEVQRVVFYEITKNAVREAMAQPRGLSIDLVNAQQARRALDYLVGFNLSPLLWKKVFPGLSAGRVQSPALRMICEREDEIAAFVPREYWTIDAELDHAEQKFPGKLTEFAGAKVEQFSFTDAAADRGVETALREAAGGLLTVTNVDRKQRRRNPAIDPEQGLAQQDHAQQFPRLAVDLGADDARVQKILELVDREQEYQRGRGHIGRHREAQQHDRAVRQQVADHRNEGGHESGHHQEFPVCQMDAGNRQRDPQVDGRQSGVDEGNFRLCEQDLAEGRPEPEDAPAERQPERTLRRAGAFDHQHACNDAGDQAQGNGTQSAQADFRQGARMVLQQAGEPVDDVPGVGRDGLGKCRRQRLAQTGQRALQALEQGRPTRMGQRLHQSGDGRDQGGDDQRRNSGERDQARPTGRQARLDRLCREMDDGVHQHSEEGRRHQAFGQDDHQHDQNQRVTGEVGAQRRIAEWMGLHAESCGGHETGLSWIWRNARVRAGGRG